MRKFTCDRLISNICIWRSAISESLSCICSGKDCEAVGSSFMAELLHSSCKDNAGDQPGQSGQKGAGQSVSRFGDFGSHEVDAHGVKNGFGAGHGDGGYETEAGVSAVFFENV